MIKQKHYIQTPTITAGITLKDTQFPEDQNMALHVCHDKSAIIHNRKSLAHALDINLTQFVCAQQTHSSNFHQVQTKDVGAGSTTMDDAILNTDGLYTFESDVVLCSFSADCVPVFLYDDTRGMIGAIHSGWQGTVKEITKSMVEHLLLIEQIQPQNLHIHIGMALSQRKFEVDSDVYDQFVALGYAEEFMYFNDTTQKYHIDNQLTVKKQCELAGVPTANITIDTTCTFEHDEGFSYRQDRSTGRHLSYIVQKR